MNPNRELINLREKFTRRINIFFSSSLNNPINIERYALFSISQLNNFLRAYLISINNRAYTANRTLVTVPIPLAYNDLINEFVKIGNPRKFRNSRAGNWTHKDEPAYHHPRVFLSIVNAIRPSNLASIQMALNNSWKIDVLRSVRNYFAHRSHGTEIEAVLSVCNRYNVAPKRVSKILLENDRAIAKKVIEDINDYISTFAEDIT